MTRTHQYFNTQPGGHSAKNAHQAGALTHHEDAERTLMVGTRSPADRLNVADTPTDRLAAQLTKLADALAVWATRQDGQPQPTVRQTGTDACDAIDTMLAELHALRSRLVAEISQSQAAFMSYLDNKYGPLSTSTHGGAA